MHFPQQLPMSWATGTITMGATGSKIAVAGWRGVACSSPFAQSGDGLFLFALPQHSVLDRSSYWEKQLCLDTSALPVYRGWVWQTRACGHGNQC